MGSTWNCRAAGAGAALQLPSAGLHHNRLHHVECKAKQSALGLGENHILTLSRTHRLRSPGAIASSRSSSSSRNFWQNLTKPPMTDLQTGLTTLLVPGTWNLGWAQRIACTTTHAHNPKSTSSQTPTSKDAEADRNEMGLSENAGFEADEPFVNGECVRVSPVDLFGEAGDGDENESVNGANDGTRSDDGYESWGSESAGSAGNESWESESASSAGSVGSAADSLAIGGKEPVYQVLEVHPGGNVVQREVSRRQLLRSIAGLRLRDIRSVDPSLWVTNSVPAILVRDQAILLNLGSLRAIATSQSVLIFEHNSVGAEAFMGALLPRLRTASNGQGPIMPFELEVVEAALISRTQRLERMLMNVEPRVMASLKVLPIRYTGDVLEELRLGKQALVELAAKAGALRQMLLEMLEHPEDIRKMTIMGRTCKVRKADGSIECTIPLDKQTAEGFVNPADEEEEIEMLLEYYLQRCDSCHGQAEKLLDAAKEMEDSIGVNLSSRRLEVSRLELLLQVGTFCSALGALVAGIFGMNLKSYLEERAMAFYITTAGIVFGGIALFIIMFTYLKVRRIL